MIESMQSQKIELTESQMNELGNALAKKLRMKRDTEHRDRWQTQWGTKTGLGLFRSLSHAMKGAELGDFSMFLDDSSKAA